MTTKIIYLVQHGEAYPKELNPDRPLTPEGKMTTRKMGEFIKNKGIQVETFWHSLKLRAKETAEILREALDLLSTPIIEYEELEPEISPKKILKEIKKTEYSNIMIVGHLPHLSKLSGLLLLKDETLEIISFEKAGIVCIEWKEEIGGILKWMITPSLIFGKRTDTG
ncbi:MAG: phosphohistidine phosphatase SixA [Candidatus Hydrogenedentes bacterium]|nr:phosphohistidine phosphatase SixA [Candidatus Hydrogenedentota bacterium]